MLLLYNIGIRLYYSVIWILSFINTKAKSWITGRKNQELIRFKSSLWFHFASLGEFEQGRPVLEAMRLKHPQKKIVITFFSPSGYVIKKNTPLADAVYYLPIDTAKNARKFINSINPEIAVFTKYEYWYYFFRELYQREIPLYVISGIFRPGQVFFSWYGGLHRQMLHFVKFFFLQDEQSVGLLRGLGLTNTIVSGDTRFDRVWENARQPKQVAYIEAFKGSHKLLVAGSTWPPDEKLLISLIAKYPDWKFIIAPHETVPEKIKDLIDLLKEHKPLKYSEITIQSEALAVKQVLIIDNVGMLSSLYQYADIAYIGGGFGAGIHNTLEAAAFGIPVIFGPEYKRFKEAHDLIKTKAGFSISTKGELESIIHKLTEDQMFYASAGRQARAYVKQNIGATDIIMAHIEP